MTTDVSSDATTRSNAQSGPRSADFETRLASMIEHAGGLLPSQGPLAGFAFLNPLQQFEDLPFEEGMLKGARLFGCSPYLSEDFYRDRLASGRILLDDIRAVLESELADSAGTPIRPSGTRIEMRLAMVQHPLRSAPPEELRWFIAETNALARFSDDTPLPIRKRILETTRHWVMREISGHAADESEPAGLQQRVPPNPLIAELLERFDGKSMEDWDDSTWEPFTLQLLWHICREGVEPVENRVTPAVRFGRHRDLLLESTGEDIDQLVDPVLIRFCATFADQGLSHWSLPDRELGFFRSFLNLYRSPVGPVERWMHPLARELARIDAAGLSAVQLIRESLDDLGVAEQHWNDFLEATLLSLRGWAGMIWQMETRQDRVARPAPRGSLIEFVAVKLLLERIALRHVVARCGLSGSGGLPELWERLHEHVAPRKSSTEQRAFFVVQLAQVMGWSPSDLCRLTSDEWGILIAEIESFPALERRRVFQRAFEHRLLVRSLDAIQIRNRRPAETVTSPQFQSVYCLDAREESFRRHLEEQSPRIETFSAAGFFGVPMYFRGIADAHFAAQCPVIVFPRHWVVEDMIYPLEQTHQFRARSRRALAIAAHQIHLDSRSFAPGAVLSAGLGTIASIPLVMRVLFPGLTASIRRTLGRMVAPPMMTRLRLERTSPVAGPDREQIGFTIPEMADMGERLLRDISLTTSFARLVFFMGHGSTGLNNPHKSTYDCGACTGNPGGPNGRALAAMLNNPKVRALLAERGLPIPEETVFVGGLHDTCEDTVTFYDLDQLPKSHFDDFAAARRAFDIACRRNAHERCRRFYSAPLDLSLDDAIRHVKDRSQDLAQTRPEFGNATNAVCIVGRRSRSRGLFLDRRCFLQSYDPTQDDDEHSILARILAAVVPVCSGINMQYNLSAVDSPGWGCGTKLPHNIASLLGVMDGAASDLRCGLPAQGVEIHEPVRLLFVIETTQDGILQVMRSNPMIGRILGNGWAQLAVLDPHSNRIDVYSKGQFQPYRAGAADLPKAPSSGEWYRGWRDHLPFALIERG